MIFSCKMAETSHYPFELNEGVEDTYETGGDLWKAYGLPSTFPPLCALLCTLPKTHQCHLVHNLPWTREYASQPRTHMPMWFLLSFVRCFFFSLVCSYSFGFYQGSQTLENNKSPRPNGLGLSSAFSCLNLGKTLPLVFKILLHILTFDRDLCGFFFLISTVRNSKDWLPMDCRLKIEHNG